MSSVQGWHPEAQAQLHIARDHTLSCLPNNTSPSTKTTKITRYLRFSYQHGYFLVGTLLNASPKRQILEARAFLTLNPQPKLKDGQSLRHRPLGAANQAHEELEYAHLPREKIRVS